MRLRHLTQGCWLLLGVSIFGFLAPGDCPAQWSSDPAVNTPVCTESGAQIKSVAVSDGAGGVIVAWVDGRRPFPFPADIYAQHLNASGVAQWEGIGVLIHPAALTGDQTNAAICSDGAGGAIIAWQDSRSGDYDIWAQRVSAAGDLLWDAGGVPACVLPPSGQLWPELVEDGAGGAIITWEDNRPGALDWDIYAQRVSAAGLLSWGPTGVPICVDGPLPGGIQAMPMLVSDGAAGAIITWYDSRGGALDIFAQRVDGTGAPQWLLNGVPICVAPLSQTQPTIATDGAGGAIITWYDFRNGSDDDIYAGRVSAAGTFPWGPDGVALCTAGFDQLYPKIISDDAGGAIVTWYDGRNGFDTDVYAQRVDSAGAALWAPDGQVVVATDGDQELPKIVGDGAGGAIISWTDERIAGNVDIYAQRMNAAGFIQWLPPTGIQLTSAPGDQNWDFQFCPIASDGNGGAIVTWTDARSGPVTDIYAQNVNRDGSLGPWPLAFWRFEEGSGTTASDASGNGHTGTLLGAARFVAATPCGFVSGRLSQYSLNIAWNPSPPPPFGAVVVADSSTLRPTDGITVEAWVQPLGSGSGGPVVSKRMVGVPPGLYAASFDLFAPYFLLPTGGVSFSLSDTSGTETRIVGLSGRFEQAPWLLPSDQWSHIAGTWDSQTQTMRLYVNFVEVASGPFAGPIGYDNGSPTLIGGAASGPENEPWYGFPGDIDEVRILDRALTPAEMLRTLCPLPPIVTVDSPAPFDTLAGGSSYDIRWRAIDDGGVSSLTIAFTSNAGTYQTVTTGEPNDSLYTWSVPRINSDLCRIRITAYDAASDSGVAYSPFTFSIRTQIGIDDTAPPRGLSLALHPNPFNRGLAVRYSLPTPGRVEISVHDVQGRRVQTLVSGTKPPGEYTATWDGREADGEQAATGVYLVRLESGGRVQTRKTVLLK